MFKFTYPDKQRLDKLKKHLTGIEDYIFGTNYKPLEDYNIYFITTNTNTQALTTFNASYKLSEKKIKSKRLKDCYSFYTHEYYTKTNQHFHTHILLFKLKKNKRLGKKALIDFFFEKKHMKSKASIDIKQVNTEKSLNARLKYIAGNKRESKNPLVIKDNEIKNQFNIPLRNIYTYAPPVHSRLSRFLTDYIAESFNATDYMYLN